MEWWVIIVEALVLGVMEFFSMIPFLLRMVLRPLQSMHQEVVSDIPGNPHAFDNVVISLFRTLPEPSNFNIVHTRVPIPSPQGVNDEQEDLLVVKGTFPPGRMHSLSIYGSTVEAPKSIELLPLSNTNRFEVLIRRKPLNSIEASAKVNVDSSTGVSEILIADSHWSNLMIVMRNYLVPPGTLVCTPEIRRAHDQGLLRAAQSLVSGPSGLAIDFRRQKKAFTRCLLLNITMWAINIIIFGQCDLVFNGVTSALAAVLAVAIRSALFEVGKVRMKQIALKDKNILQLMDLEKASQSSQPSKLHTYYFMTYELPDDDHELRITANIDSRRQKYWSFIVYDEYGLPLPQYVFDENAHKVVTDSTQESHIYSVDIRMRVSHSQESTSAVGEESTVVPLQSHQRRGYALFRLVHPADEQVKLYSQPVVNLVNYKSSDLKRD